MGKFGPFYLWFVITLAVASLVYWIGIYNGWALYVYKLDVTHVTQVIAFIAVMSNFILGYVEFQYAKNGTPNFMNDFDPRWYKKRVIKWLKGLWFYTNQLFLWGILGTVMGSMYLFYSSFQGDVSSMTLQTLVPHLLPPLGIVFSATGLALASVLLLMNQLFWFNALAGITEEETD